MSTPIARALRHALAAGALGLILAAGCASDGAFIEGAMYGSAVHDDPWYWGDCCYDWPDTIGPPPPRPEHPVAKPPPARPEHPVATPPVARPTPMPRPAAMPRGGAGRR